MSSILLVHNMIVLLRCFWYHNIRFYKRSKLWGKDMLTSTIKGSIYNKKSSQQKQVFHFTDKWSFEVFQVSLQIEFININGFLCSFMQYVWEWDGSRQVI